LWVSYGFKFERNQAKNKSSRRFKFAGSNEREAGASNRPPAPPPLAVLAKNKFFLPPLFAVINQEKFCLKNIHTLCESSWEPGKARAKINTKQNVGTRKEVKRNYDCRLCVVIIQADSAHFITTSTGDLAKTNL
jgi:hypothetical protein